MKNFLLLILISFMMTDKSMSIFDFEKESDLSNWDVVDDVVMGGRSDGHFAMNKAGHGVFFGAVSLENYGGFSSVRYRFEQLEVTTYKMLKIRLKGDGKRYQFRVKTDKYDRHSYIQYFETSGDWETIELPMIDMYPSFRGRRLNMTNYPATFLEEIAILIANKKAETFQLEIDWIVLE